CGGYYAGPEALPVVLEDVSGYPRLFAALADRGWSDQDLTKLAGGNVLRVMRDAEAGARDLQATRGPSLATYEGLALASTRPREVGHEKDYRRRRAMVSPTRRATTSARYSMPAICS